MDILFALDQGLGFPGAIQGFVLKLGFLIQMAITVSQTLCYTVH